MRRKLTWALCSLALVPAVFLPLRASLRTDGAMLFEDVRARVLGGAVDSLSDDQLWERAARGLVDRLDDPYADLYSPEQMASFNRNTLRNDYGGVGMGIQDQLGTVVVTTVYPGTAAAGGGVQAGDRIMKVDGVPTTGLRLDEVSARLVGTPGSEVRVEFARPGVRAPITMRFVRSKVHIPAVPYAIVLEGDVGYIPLQRFNDAAASEVAVAIAQLNAQHVRGVILDLRGNPGGSLNEAVAISDLFLRPGQEIVTVRYRDRDPEVHRSGGSVAARAVKSSTRAGNEPLVVLVDGDAASAAEIVAGALQDHDRALVVGTTSFGKGLVQSIYPLRQGWALKLTTAKWFTPSGRSIQRERVMKNGRFVAAAPDSLETDSARLARPAYRSDAGRIVYGGGGIAPDVVVPADTISTVEQNLLKSIAPKSQQTWRTLYDLALEVKGTVQPGFAVPQAWRDSLFVRLDRAGAPLPRPQFDSAGALVDRLIAQQVTTFAFGDSAAFRRLVPLDTQLVRALELLQRARSQESLFATALAGKAGN
jgi:carboxyl-terminal processing protease